MTRRLLGPVSGPILFFCVAALVFAGLGWVTVAALRVEDAQREAAARGELESHVRDALWKLDGRMLATLGVEDNRPYHHFIGDVAANYGPTSTPLLAAKLPDWIALHVQIDPETGWGSPQVLSPEAIDRLREQWPDLDLRNVTPERGERLSALRASFPFAKVIDTLAMRERTTPADSPLATWLFNNEGEPVQQQPDSGPLPPQNATPISAPKVPAAETESLNPARRPLERSESTESARKATGESPTATNSISPLPGQPQPKSTLKSVAPEGVAQAPTNSVNPVQQAVPQFGGAQFGGMPRGGTRGGDGTYNPSANLGGRVGTINKSLDEVSNGRNFTMPNSGKSQTASQQPNNTTQLPAPSAYSFNPSSPGMGGVPGPGGPGGPPLGASGGPGPGAGGYARGTPPPGGAPTEPPARSVASAPVTLNMATPTSGVPTPSTVPTPTAPAGRVGFGVGGGGGVGGFGGGNRPGGSPAPNLAAKDGKQKSDAVPAVPSLMSEATSTRPDDMDGGFLRNVASEFFALNLRKANRDQPEYDDARKDMTQRYAAGDSAEKESHLNLKGGAPGRPEQGKLESADTKKLQEGGKDKNESVQESLRIFRQRGVEDSKQQPGDKPMADKRFAEQSKLTDEAKGDAERNTEKKVTPTVIDPAPVPPKPEIVLGSPVAVHLGAMRPQWLTATDGGDVLLLVRAAKLEAKTVYQGVVIDWAKLEAVLLDEVKERFPTAKLVPVRDSAQVSPDRAMASLPVQLDPGPSPALPPAGWTPLRIGLVLAWVAAVIAFAAVGLSGWSLIDSSERKMRFVSAVTHELRTPLTSLRLYIDLLLSGMIEDEEKRKEYLATLNVESDRLHRLIDNVLDYARLEGRRRHAGAQPVLVSDLLDQVRQTWSDRCGNDGKELLVISTLLPDQKVCADEQLVQQIVGNLIDNARKYTRDAADQRIWLWAKPDGSRRVVIEVEDRGPGVPPRERRHIFRPFRRGDAAETRAGGAGLGLALAKQWAEAMGGHLTYRPADGGTGACFRLELRVK